MLIIGQANEGIEFDIPDGKHSQRNRKGVAQNQHVTRRSCENEKGKERKQEKKVAKTIKGYKKLMKYQQSTH